MTYPRGTDDTKRALTTLIDVFRSLEGRRGEFVIHDDGYRVRRFSYAQVTAAARGFAARLAAAGVQRGDTVLLWGENCAEWLACYWGAVIAGVVVVPIDYRSSAAFARKVAGIVKARVALAGAEVEHEAAHPHAAGTPAMDFSPGVPLWSFADFDWKADGPLPALTITRDDIAQIVFTSGATAEPKGVVIRHKNLLANMVPVATEVAKYKTYARPFLPLRFLNLLPLSHMFGQSMATNIPPLVDGTVVFMRSFNPHDIVTPRAGVAHLGHRLRAEDPRRAARARGARRSRPPPIRQRGCRFRRAGGATDRFTACSARSSGPSSSAPRRSDPSSRISGSASASS